VSGCFLSLTLSSLTIAACDERVYEGKGAAKKFELASAKLHERIGKFVCARVIVDGKTVTRMCPRISGVQLKRLVDNQIALHQAQEAEVKTGEGHEGNEKDEFRLHVSSLIAMQKGVVVANKEKEQAAKEHADKIHELHQKVL
jgi:hypothetical protein